MPKYEIKTKLNDASVTAFLDAVDDEVKREDCYVISDMMQKATKAEPKMWGSAIVGFGSYHYKGKSGIWQKSCLFLRSPLVFISYLGIYIC